MNIINIFEQLFEKVLWNSRLVVLSAVIASLFVSFCMFYVATVDVFTLGGHVVHYAGAGSDMTSLRSVIVAHVVEIVDGYLLGAIMFIFSLGLYELFVSRIDIAEGSEFASRVLLIKSLDDLKDRLAKVVLLILVVKFFEFALHLKFNTPLDLLYLAMGIFLLAAGLYLSHGNTRAGHS